MMLAASIISCLCVAAVVRASSGGCEVVPKEAWEGVSRSHVEYLPRPVGLVVVQHTATPACRTDSGCEALLRSVQRYHMDQLHYWDIGPNFLVGGNGKVYEGSGWLHVGAHTYKYNRRSIGISFIGNFNEDVPAKSALEAAMRLIECGVSAGHLRADYQLLAHRQLIATDSPGRKIYSEMRRWPHWLEDAAAISDH